MDVFKRWIALVPMALMLSVGLSGCKTGMNHWSCHQTSCASTCSNANNGCVNSHFASCLSKGCSCGANANGSCGANGNGCACGANGNGCACGSGKSCLSSCLSKSAGKIHCGSMGCKTGCTSGCGVTLQNPQAIKCPYESEPSRQSASPETRSPTRQAGSRRESGTLPKPMPKPIPDARAEDFPLPPGPAAEAETTQNAETPVLRVSQTRVVSVNSARENRLNASAQELQSSYSQAWNDAMGLPTIISPSSIPSYR